MSQPGPYSIAVCPRCLSRLRIKQSSLGKTIGCTNCDHRFVAQATLGLDDDSSGDYTAPPVSIPRSEERLEIFCPECAAGLSVRKVYIGQHVRCRKCNHKFVVPSLIAPIIPPSLESSSGKDDLDTLDQLARLSGQNDLKQAHDALHEIQSAHAELQRAHASLQTRCDELEPKQEKLAAERDRLVLELERARVDRDRLSADLGQVKVELETLQHELGSFSPTDAREALLESERLAGEVGRLHGMLAQRETEAANALEARTALESGLRAVEDQRAEFEQARAADQARIEALVQAQAGSERTLQEALEKESHHELEIQALADQIALSLEASKNQASEADAGLKSQLEQARLDLVAADQRVAVLERTNREMTTALGRLGVGPIRRRS